MSIPSFSDENDASGRLVSGFQNAPDFSRVLVVGKSPINRVVMSKIVERSGLKPISETPETAGKALELFVPGTVVLDGGAENRDCDCLMPVIAAARRLAGAPTPSVILLSNSVGTAQSPELSSLIDAVVTKPITPEQLQPVIERMAGRVRT